MNKDIAHFVKVWMKCQVIRVFYLEQVGHLQLLSIPLGPWHNMSMDFIISFLKSQGNAVILMMVDWPSKLVYMVQIVGTAIVLDTIKLFLYAWWRYHKLPILIVSD
jgi:hypothetical protein